MKSLAAFRLRRVLADKFVQKILMMRRSKIVMPVHLVWATHGRLPLIHDDYKEELFDCLRLELAKLRVKLLAIGGVEDHVHVALLLPATRTIAEIVKQLKGTSSRLLAQKLAVTEGFFKWQEGYGAFAFHIGLKNRVVAYVENQVAHHADSELWPVLEAVDEDASLVCEDADEVGYEARDFNPSCLESEL